ncbi:MAG: ABC transporter ATP-binding protein [Phycisphaeraceae bacterium]|nr:MAG: ABC transporter ATP-binding protein [Phycisphaeraceae bacterium]
MVALDRVHKWYGRVHALRGVSFELHPGQVAGLLGPNGAGKSTTIRILTGMIPPDAGHASIRALDTLNQSLAARAKLGYLPESAPLYPEMRVADYLAFRARLYPLDRSRRPAAIDRAIERCWLRDVRTRRIGHLSKGYRQRVGLAAAILHDPEVLILDEPTNGLDPTQIAQMRTLVRELGSDRTMLISSHILPEIEQICSRILIVASGELKADGTPAELIAKHGGPSRLIVEARCTPEKAGLILGLPQQSPRLTELSEGWTRIESPCAPHEPDPRERIAHAFAASGTPVRELRLTTATVEDVFLALAHGREGTP